MEITNSFNIKKSLFILILHISPYFLTEYAYIAGICVKNGDKSSFYAKFNRQFGILAL